MGNLIILVGWRPATLIHCVSSIRNFHRRIERQLTAPTPLHSSSMRTLFSLICQGCWKKIKKSTESNRKHPRGSEEKRKTLSHIQIRYNLLDFHSLLSFLLSFQTNVSEDYFLQSVPVGLSPEKISCKKKITNF